MLRNLDRTQRKHKTEDESRRHLVHELPPPLFKHRALNVYGEENRLFRLAEQVSDTGDISGALKVFDLAQCPSYQALSYTWGDSNDASTAKNVLVNGAPFKVWPNLHGFLETCSRWSPDAFAKSFHKYIDFANSPLEAYLWIDQLCIDQKSIIEKNQQVQMMGQIYKQARQVVVWLGGQPRLGLEKEFKGMIEADRDDMYLEEFEDTTGHHIDNILRQPYWSRLWIIQELVFGPIWSCFASKPI